MPESDPPCRCMSESATSLAIRMYSMPGTMSCSPKSGAQRLCQPLYRIPLSWLLRQAHKYRGGGWLGIGECVGNRCAYAGARLMPLKLTIYRGIQACMREQVRTRACVRACVNTDLPPLVLNSVVVGAPHHTDGGAQEEGHGHEHAQRVACSHKWSYTSSDKAYTCHMRRR